MRKERRHSAKSAKKPEKHVIPVYSGKKLMLIKGEAGHEITNECTDESP